MKLSTKTQSINEGRMCQQQNNNDLFDFLYSSSTHNIEDPTKFLLLPKWFVFFCCCSFKTTADIEEPNEKFAILLEHTQFYNNFILDSKNVFILVFYESIKCWWLVK